MVGRGLRIAVGAAVLVAFAQGALGELQFDVFAGYDGVIPQASWFPVVCEAKNDGPTFTATVEVGPGNLGAGPTYRMKVELPTGTLKRFEIPVFSDPGAGNWDVKLLDERGKVRSEQIGVESRKAVSTQTLIVGALTRTAGGVPTVKTISNPSSDLQPVVARLLPPIFPDNPLTLEGMKSLYLSSERATQLTLHQADAILAWLEAGGHLIVGVDQLTDINATRWLRNLVPCNLSDIRTIKHGAELDDWLRNTPRPANLGAYTPPVPGRYGPWANRGPRAFPPPSPVSGGPGPFADLEEDSAFRSAELEVAVGRVREGSVEVSAGDTPLVVNANRGRGQVTLLTFSPEREPFLSWKNLPSFWAKRMGVPGDLYVTKNVGARGGWSSDGVFGAMIDSRQVHTLPIEWLLLLLVVYLVVIGPLDQYWLKKIGRPMLTWITFPCYVVLFSLLIYAIGYKLRAGDSEWNELHLVDVLGNGSHVELRGRTYASVYSPANQRYGLRGQEDYAAVRGEFYPYFRGGSQSDNRTSVALDGDTFEAQIFVPVWLPELFESDWFQAGSAPMTADVTRRDGGWHVRVVNRTGRKLGGLKLVVNERVIDLGDLVRNGMIEKDVGNGDGMPLREFVMQYGGGANAGESFQGAVQARQRAFGVTQQRQIGDLPNTTVAASFLSELSSPGNYGYGFISPPGLDMTSFVERGGAVLFAWDADYSPVGPMNQFTPRRHHRNTLWRIPLTVQ